MPQLVALLPDERIRTSAPILDLINICPLVVVCIRGKQHQHGAGTGGGASAPCTDADCTAPSGMRGRLTPEELLSWPQMMWRASAGSASESSDDEDLVILPFDTFAACRWLDASPDDAEASS